MGILRFHKDIIKQNSLALTVREFFFVVLVVFGIFSTDLKAQEVQDLPNGEVGIKAGVASGLSLLKYTRYNNAVEAIVMTNWDGFILAALYHVNFDLTDQLKPTRGRTIGYISAGGHYAYFAGESVLYVGEGIGPDAGLGLTYLFDNVPFSVTLDNRFFLDFPLMQRGGTLLADLSLNIRYVF